MQASLEHIVALIWRCDASASNYSAVRLLHNTIAEKVNKKELEVRRELMPSLGNEDIAASVTVPE